MTASATAAVHGAGDSRKTSDTAPWWRQPYCWLIIAGPLAVVIAGLITTFIAYRGADGVEPAYVIARKAAGAVSMQPAMAARNGTPVASGLRGH